MAAAAKRRVNSRSENGSYTAAARSAVRMRTISTETAAYKGNVRTKAKRKRSRALAMGRGFVLFLAVISAACVLLCVRFLQMKTTINEQMRQNDRLAAELAEIRAENDALYADIEKGVDLEKIRFIAINRYGMNYATEDQVVWYNTGDKGYVRQYQDVPAS